jgi:hypothetical protein
VPKRGRNTLFDGTYTGVGTRDDSHEGLEGNPPNARSRLPFPFRNRKAYRRYPQNVERLPQWQKSKGWLIAAAALELSGNQVTHFYSRAKNTAEMIRMAKVLLEEYRTAEKLYLSWDAAPWHMSKELLAFVEKHNGHADGASKLELAPLPASAQFLNVIDSVFSGMSRAIIRSSDYPSVDAAMAAIDRYFQERNQTFRENPRRAGRKIWGKERTIGEFDASNICKDPAYR